MIKIQDAYINTYHPDFMGGSNSIVNVFDVANYDKEQLNAMANVGRQRSPSFDNVVGEEEKQSQ